MGGATTTGVSGPGSIDGLRYDWASEDLPINEAVTNWADRISGSIWRSPFTTAVVSPTNTADGIYFQRTSSQYLTNNAPVGAATNTHWVLCNILSDTTPSVGKPILAMGSAGPNTRIYGQYNSGLELLAGWAPSYMNVLRPWFTNWIDIAIVTTGASAAFYYRGNLLTNSTSQIGIMPSTTVWEWMGKWSSYYGDMRFRRFCVWTNVALTPTEIQNLHTWATNQYNYVP